MERMLVLPRKAINEEKLKKISQEMKFLGPPKLLGFVQKNKFGEITEIYLVNGSHRAIAAKQLGYKIIVTDLSCEEIAQNENPYLLLSEICDHDFEEDKTFLSLFKRNAGKYLLADVEIIDNPEEEMRRMFEDNDWR